MKLEVVKREILSRLQSLRSLNAESIRAVRREFSRRLPPDDPVAVVELALGLLDANRLLACELVFRHPAALKSLGPSELERFARDLGNWGDVDVFAVYLVGPTWRDGRVSDAFIHEWAASPNRWLRRTALVATVPLNSRSQGGDGDTPRTVEACRRLVADRDDMVVKAMSWALRELSKRDRQSVAEFLAEHEARLAPRVLREVRNKLSTGLKNPRSW